VTEEKIIYLYGNEEEGLSGEYEPIDRSELVNVQLLHNEINKQKIDLLNGDHVDGYIIPWEGLLVCAEGVFKWFEDIEEYLQVGGLGIKDQIVFTDIVKPQKPKKRYAVVKEGGIRLFLPSSTDDFYEYKLEYGEAFEIVGEVVYYVGTESVLHYVVILGDDLATTAIPSIKTIICIGSENLEKVRALI
jgi:hypothetical protein